ncbi:MAG: hypothetical protein RI885_1665 [Actinomycetota bacterium]|jgi:NAD(P)-dependent dehydrogenase (short-subunit alcohol dehydrogenase family)
MTRLIDKRAIITGATTGIGFATAAQFVDEGARVLITGSDPARLSAAKAELDAIAGGVGRVVSARVDVRDLATLDGLAELVRSEFGGADILFANAGVTYLGAMEHMTPDRFDDEMAINLRGTYFTVQRLLEVLQDGASVILNSSCVASTGVAGMTVYSATKAGVRSLARSMSAELMPRRIRVNAVAPGPIDTPLYSKMGLSDEQLGAMIEGTLARTPLGRTGRADEVARVVTFLASDDSSYLLGAEIPVDGGWTAL